MKEDQFLVKEKKMEPFFARGCTENRPVGLSLFFVFNGL